MTTRSPKGARKSKFAEGQVVALRYDKTEAFKLRERFWSMHHWRYYDWNGNIFDEEELRPLTKREAWRMTFRNPGGGAREARKRGEREGDPDQPRQRATHTY